MGWRLVAEILDQCPDIRYREFRVLIALALDARDETRQGMPGQELLTLRANCGMRATRYAMAALIRRGLIKTARRPAPSVRAVYEILPMPGTGASMPARVTGARYEPTHAKTRPTGARISAPTQSLVSSHDAQSSLWRARAALADAGATEREIESIITNIKTEHARGRVRNVAAYLRKCIANGDASDLIEAARAELAEKDRYDQQQAPPSVSENGSTSDIPFWSRSELCRDEQHDDCAWSRCQCRCHRSDEDRAAIRARAEAIAEAKAELAHIRAGHVP
jgi:hypothetical protein